MIISYKTKFPWGAPTNFEQKRKDGIKIHTIRADPHNRWHAGRKAHEAHGVRTKNYRCFLESECKWTQSIDINYYPNQRNPERADITIVIAGNLFYRCENYIVVFDNGVIELAKNDGFDSVEDFFKWFDTDFTGKIIHFTDFKY